MGLLQHQAHMEKQQQMLQNLYNAIITTSVAREEHIWKGREGKEMGDDGKELFLFIHVQI